MAQRTEIPALVQTTPLAPGDISSSRAQVMVWPLKILANAIYRLVCDTSGLSDCMSWEYFISCASLFFGVTNEQPDILIARTVYCGSCSNPHWYLFNVCILLLADFV
jgi:hypothetical protein